MATWCDAVTIVTAVTRADSALLCYQTTTCPTVHISQSCADTNRTPSAGGCACGQRLQMHDCLCTHLAQHAHRGRVADKGREREREREKTHTERHTHERHTQRRRRTARWTCSYLCERPLFLARARLGFVVVWSVSTLRCMYGKGTGARLAHRWCALTT